MLRVIVAFIMLFFEISRKRMRQPYVLSFIFIDQKAYEAWAPQSQRNIKK